AGVRRLRALGRRAEGAARIRVRGAVRIPRALYIPAVVAIALLVLPIVGLISRVRWQTLPGDLFSREALTALLLSLATAACATVVCLLVGAPLAVLIARARRSTASVLRTLVLVPLVLPPMVGGLALLSLLGRSGLIGEPLYEATGFSL